MFKKKERRNDILLQFSNCPPLADIETLVSVVRSSDEISSEKFAEFRNKFNTKINTLNETFDKIVALDENTKTSFESVQTLRNVIESITIKNDDSVLSIVSYLFKK